MHGEGRVGVLSHARRLPLGWLSWGAHTHGSQRLYARTTIRSERKLKTTVSDIRLIQHLDSSLMVRRWRLIGHFLNPIYYPQLEVPLRGHLARCH
jgi:hypothetical protein